MQKQKEAHCSSFDGIRICGSARFLQRNRRRITKGSVRSRMNGHHMVIVGETAICSTAEACAQEGKSVFDIKALPIQISIAHVEFEQSELYGLLKTALLSNNK